MRFLKSIGLALCFGGLSTTIHAIGWKPVTNPPYWAGTNNKVTLSCYPGAGEVGIIAWQIECLTSGGDLVYQNTAELLPALKLANGVATFDSTHFADGDTVQFRIKAKASLVGGGNSPWQTGPIQESKVYNKSSIYATTLYPFSLIPSGGTDSHGKIMATTAELGTIAMRYRSQYCVYSSPWTYSTFNGSTGDTNLVIFGGHGSWDAAELYDAASNEPNILPTDINTIQAAKGTGVPPIHFFWMLSCRQGLRATEWTLPLQPGYPGLTDQVTLGYAVYISQLAASGLPSPFLALTEAGFTVDEAAKAVATENNGYIVSEAPTVDDIGNPMYARPIDENDHRCIGDKFTKLHGVYTGTNSIETAWHRQ